jgi:hypothetical protein
MSSVIRLHLGAGTLVRMFRQPLPARRDDLHS